MKFGIKLIVGFFFCTLRVNDLPGQVHLPEMPNIHGRVNTIQLIHPRLVNRFYEINQEKAFWFLANEQSLSLRLALKDIVDNAANMGLDRNKYHYTELVDYTRKDFQIPDRAIVMSMDSIFTDTAIA